MTKTKGILSILEETRTFNPPEELRKGTFISSNEQYRDMYQRSLEDPGGFWGAYAAELEWHRKWDTVLEYDFEKAQVQWFIGGKINAAYNCLDRHLKKNCGDKTAIIWEAESGEGKTYTYQELHEEVCRCANVLKRFGVKKGDRVAIYLSMIPELPIAMLACARIGAIHSVVFGSLSAEALQHRIMDCDAKLLITSNFSLHGGAVVPTKALADKALEQCPQVSDVIVVRRLERKVEMAVGRDRYWDELMAEDDSAADCEPAVMDAEDPLFILYTSGTTGEPKGIVHTIAGYLLYCKKTFEWVFDCHDEDIFWCTADMGWIAGHSYGVYGPLCAGATSVIYEGALHYPAPDRLWRIVKDHRVTIFYTMPTIVRACMKEGDEWVAMHDLSSLRVLGSVGEPLNPEVWIWYYTAVGGKRCPIVDTWWQTETGGILIAPLPGAMSQKPGSVCLPFFGVEPAVLRDDGTDCEVNEGGYLVIKRPWPGMMRSSYGDPEQFKDTYFVQFPGVYFTGDCARKDEDGYFWLMGRVDDVINVSGYRIGATEIESALVSHKGVVEAAVVGFPHEVKGEGIYAFVTLKPGVEKTEALREALIAHVRTKIGPIATPDKIQFIDIISKTMHGKIMRRELRKIAEDDLHTMDDTTVVG